MSAAEITERTADSSPLFKARMAGVFYLLTFLIEGFAEFARGQLVVYGDAAATATNILTHEPLYRLGFACDLVQEVCAIAVALLLYELLKPVNRSLSLLAAFFSLVGCTIGALSYLFHLAPFVLLRGAPYLSVFTVGQLQALTLMFLKLRAQGSTISMVFFGFHLLLIGTLIFRSTFLPRILGALMAFAGLGWLTFLWPPLASHLSPYILAPGLLGTGSLTLWLLVKGVDVQRWKEKAGVAGASIRT